MALSKAPVPQVAGTQDQADSGNVASAEITKSDNPTLEAFVVSRCPYGLQMQRALAEAIKEQPELAKYALVKYIGEVNSDGKTILSMHGEAEAVENLRQICIRDEQPEKYWDYVSCQMQAGDTTGCEQSTGVDSEELNACISDASRGVTYAKEDFAENAQYNITGSPTLILNGANVKETNYGGRSADGVRAMVCAAFDGAPDFCSKTLDTTPAAVSFSATYAASGGSASASAANCDVQ